MSGTGAERLAGRRILVTGAYGGIGFAIAAACLAEGARVALHARREGPMRAAVDKLGGGDKLVGVLGDLSDGEAAMGVVDAAAEALGGLDGLVNNAARLDRSTLEQIDAAHLEAMFAVNLHAPLLMTKAALAHFSAAGREGVVVNIGSINAHCGAPNLLAYSATKAALMTATRNLADALGGRPIRVNQINVGWTLTENERVVQRAEGQPEDWVERLPEAFAPRGMIIRPDEVAKHVAFWLSDDSAPANGQVYELEQYPLIGRNRISER